MLNEVKWHASADVVVVGYGAAGAAAAITASENGSSVILLEKQESSGHQSNSSLSGGNFISPADPQAIADYFTTLCRVDENMAWTDRDVIKVWAKYTCQGKEWFEAHGAALKSWPGVSGSHRELPGNENIRIFYFDESGIGMMKFLDSLVKGRKVEVKYATAGKKLITENQRVVGLTAQEKNGKEFNIRANKALILTTGGFEFDDTMKLQYLRAYPYYFTGSDANTGDGVRMAMSVGSDLWHMNCASAGFVMKFPELRFGFDPYVRGGNVARASRTTRSQSGGCGYIIVDKKGHRFTNENFKNHHVANELAGWDSKALEYPRIPSFWVMDQRRFTSGQLPLSGSGPAGPSGLYKWSDDNLTELAKGWILKGNTVSELESKLGVPGGSLVDTIDNYNNYCKNKEDLELRRRPETLVPLNRPPYYAVKLWPGGPNTQGGPRHNAKAQVLNVSGEAIPGLYAAGECGSSFGMLYTGGGNLAECIAFGRVAGENAAAEKSR